MSDVSTSAARRRMWTSAALIITTFVTGAGVVAANQAYGATAAPSAAPHPAPLWTSVPPPSSPSTTAPPGMATATPGTTPTATWPTPGKSPQPPGAPVNLTVTAVTSRSVTLSWTPSTPGCCGIDGYELFHLYAFSDVISRQDVGKVTTVTIEHLSPTSEHRFWLVARDTMGRRSGPSNTVTAVTPITDTGPDTVPPQAPTALAASDVTARTAVLTWSPSTDNVGVTGYHVYRLEGLYMVRLLGTVSGTSFTVPLTSSNHQFFVRARDAVGNLSAVSNMVAVTVPTPPTSPSVPPPSSPPVDPLSCRVTYTPTSQWAGGFVADVTVANIGTNPIAGWTLTFAFGGDQQITSAWNATVSQSGATVTMANAAWNGAIAPGGSTSLGFLGRWTASNAPPSSFTLNGVRCAAG